MSECHSPYLKCPYCIAIFITILSLIWKKCPLCILVDGTCCPVRNVAIKRLEKGEQISQPTGQSALQSPFGSYCPQIGCCRVKVYRCKTAGQCDLPHPHFLLQDPKWPLLPVAVSGRRLCALSAGPVPVQWPASCPAAALSQVDCE